MWVPLSRLIKVRHKYCNAACGLWKRWAPILKKGGPGIQISELPFCLQLIKYLTRGIHWVSISKIALNQGVGTGHPLSIYIEGGHATWPSNQVVGTRHPNRSLKYTTKAMSWLQSSYTAFKPPSPPPGIHLKQQHGKEYSILIIKCDRCVVNSWIQNTTNTTLN